MDVLLKLERMVQGWLKGLPHLPVGVRQWLGSNIWWIAAIGAVLSGLAAFTLMISLFTNLSALTTPFVSYYASPTFVTWVIIKTIITLVFTVLECVLLAMAITPLKEKQKKGWVLMFAVLLLGVLSAVVSAFLTLSVFSFIISIIFSAIWLAVSAYLLFEIHGEFAHVEHSKGTKRKAKAAK